MTQGSFSEVRRALFGTPAEPTKTGLLSPSEAELAIENDDGSWIIDAEASALLDGKIRDRLAKLGLADPKAQRMKLGEFIDLFIAERSSMKSSTLDTSRRAAIVWSSILVKTAAWKRSPKPTRTVGERGGRPAAIDATANAKRWLIIPSADAPAKSEAIAKRNPKRNPKPQAAAGSGAEPQGHKKSPQIAGFLPDDATQLHLEHGGKMGVEGLEPPTLSV